MRVLSFLNISQEAETIKFLESVIVDMADNEGVFKGDADELFRFCKNVVELMSRGSTYEAYFHLDEYGDLNEPDDNEKLINFCIVIKRARKNEGSIGYERYELNTHYEEEGLISKHQYKTDWRNERF